MKLDDAVDTIYIITIPERINYVKKLMKQLNLKYTIINAHLKKYLNKEQLINNKIVTNKSLSLGSIACHLSHLKAVKAFLKSGKNNCLIFEDDIKIPSKKELNYLKKNLKDLKWILNRPNMWEIIYLGKCWNTCIFNKQIKNNLYSTNNTLCRHAYILNRKSAAEYLKLLPIYNYGDVMVNNKFNKKIVFHPSIFYQNEDKSSLDRQNIILKLLDLENLDNNGGFECTNYLLRKKSVKIIIIIILILILSIIFSIIYFVKR